MSNIYKYIVYILLSILCKIIAKEVIIENENINDLENVIKDNSQEESLILKFKERYYDMSNFPFKKIYFLVNSNVTFSGYSDGTILDFKNITNGIMDITYSEHKGITLKFENMIFKNFGGQEIKTADYMFEIDFDSDENYLQFENCTFMNIQYTIFYILNLNASYKKYNNNSDYFITFVNCNF